MDAKRLAEGRHGICSLYERWSQYLRIPNQWQRELRCMQLERSKYHAWRCYSELEGSEMRILLPLLAFALSGVLSAQTFPMPGPSVPHPTAAPAGPTVVQGCGYFSPNNLP